MGTPLQVPMHVPQYQGAQGPGWCHGITRRSQTPRTWLLCRTRATVSLCDLGRCSLSLHDFLLPFNLDPVTFFPPAAPCASLLQDFVPLMAENFLQFSSLNLFMASVYFLFLCQVCLLDLLPPQHFPCPHLFIESNLFSFFFFFSQHRISSCSLFQNPTFGLLSSLPL